MQVLNRTLPTNTAKKTIFHQVLIDTRGLTQSIEQNKEGETSAEVEEGRVLIKENSQQTVADWTQGQRSTSLGLLAVGKVVRCKAFYGTACGKDAQIWINVPSR